jgi:hypothetical protein
MIAPSMTTAAIGCQMATTHGIKNSGMAITMRPVRSRTARSHISWWISRRPRDAHSHSAQNAMAANRNVQA